MNGTWLFILIYNIINSLFIFTTKGVLFIYRCMKKSLWKSYVPWLYLHLKEPPTFLSIITDNLRLCKPLKCFLWNITGTLLTFYFILCLDLFIYLLFLFNAIRFIFYVPLRKFESHVLYGVLFILHDSCRFVRSKIYSLGILKTVGQSYASFYNRRLSTQYFTNVLDYLQSLNKTGASSNKKSLKDLLLQSSNLFIIKDPQRDNCRLYLRRRGT